MDFTGRPMLGMVSVDPPGFSTDAALAAWVGSLPDGAAYPVSAAMVKQAKAPTVTSAGPWNQ